MLLALSNTEKIEGPPPRSGFFPMPRQDSVPWLVRRNTIIMSCLIVSDLIRVQLNNLDVAVPVEHVIAPGSIAAARSALQRPDMNRMRLAAMLRRSGTRTGVDGMRLTWASMLNSRMANCANSN